MFGECKTAKICKMKIYFLLTASLLFGNCSKKMKTDDPAVWQKIKIDFSKIDEVGLAGTADGKVAVHYEFCIPADEKMWKKVRKIDPTAQKSTARGRIGCTKNEWLILGMTHQKNYRRVLFDLASLTFVKKIEENFWE